MQTTKLSRNLHLVPNMSKMGQLLALKQISQKKKKKKTNDFFLIEQKLEEIADISFSRVIFREPLLSSFRVCGMIWQTADYF